MRRTLSAWALALCLVAPAVAHASAMSDRTEWDFSVKMGVTTGRIKREKSSVKDEFQTDYAGIPLGIALNQDMTRWLSLGVEFHLVSDYKNVQVTETGLHLGIAVHIFGGSRRTLTDLGYAQFVYRDPYNFSFLFRLAYSHYNVSPRNIVTPNASLEINGSSLETMIGLQFRQDLTDVSAFTIEGFFTFTSLPASSDERVSTARNEILFAYRFFL